MFTFLWRRKDISRPFKVASWFKKTLGNFFMSSPGSCAIQLLYFYWMQGGGKQVDEWGIVI